MYLQHKHIEETINYLSNDMNDGYVYSFGIYTGKACLVYLKQFEQKGINIKQLLGFDSLEGLPVEKEGVWFHKDWQPGVFSSQEHFGVHSKKEAYNKLYELWGEYGKKIELIVGWFKDSLNKETYQLYNMQEKPAVFVDVDTDLYSGAFEALDFMFQYQIPKRGVCVVRYDDWASCIPFEGEQRAHLEISRKYHVVWEPLAANLWKVLDYV